jgi:hypothetical protein
MSEEIQKDIKTLEGPLIEKKPVGRPRKYSHGAKEEGKISKYHQNYYHKTNKEILCDLCGKKTTTRTLYQHKLSIKCKYQCLLKEKEKNI